MTAHRVAFITLGQIMKSRTAIGKYYTKIKTLNPSINLQHQLPRQRIWKSAAFRTSVTGTVKRAIDVIKNDRLGDVDSGILIAYSRQCWPRRFFHKGTPHHAPLRNIPKQLSWFNVKTKFPIFNVRWMLGGYVTSAVAYLVSFYHDQLVKLPLNGRKAFLVLSDQEAMDHFHWEKGITNQEFETITTVDNSGNPTDELTMRVKKIMDELRQKNKEYDEFLIQGGKWQAVVLNTLDEPPSSFESNGDGTIFVAKHILENKDIDDDALAFFLAHEMVHTIQKHRQELLGFNSFFRIFISNVISPMMRSSSEFRWKGFLDDLEKKFDFSDSEVYEKEADEFGFKFASKACFNYRRFCLGLVNAYTHEKQITVKFMEKLGIQTDQPEQPQHADSFISDYEQSKLYFKFKHPSIKDRITLLQSEDWQAKALTWRQEGTCDPLPNEPRPIVQFQPDSDQSFTVVYDQA